MVLSFNHLNIYILNLPSHICDINIPCCIFLREYFPEVDQKRPKNVVGLPHACTVLYQVIVQYIL